MVLIFSLSLCESLSKKNRDLLRLEAQEKRRREAAGEEDQFPGKTPTFAKPYKTNKRDALSRHIRNIMGSFNDFKVYMRQNFQKVMWTPKKLKSRSQTGRKSHEPSCSQTKSIQDSVTEQQLKNARASKSLELDPSLEETNCTDVPAVEDILREMTSSFSQPLSPLHVPPKAEPSKAPCSTQDTDGSVAQNQEQSGTASGTLLSSRPTTSWLLDDLQLSDSEESEDNQVVEKPPSPLAGPSSSSPDTSDSESSSGSETQHTVGTKRPGKPLVHNSAKRCRREDSEP
ncbi:AF4/FMR2 family member 1-like [Empidonax traillii]|uniref:AF4/FMR2 family member 1-like n=1 Tax=Empidonax traillii TaxID=164674 RepID=UPI000FFCEAB3|nr:AF4/FMR2 family member 1-like [Empidonax traillii]